jgi:hypothetical protein
VGGRVYMCQGYEARIVSGHVYMCQGYQARIVSGHVYVSGAPGQDSERSCIYVRGTRPG